MREGFSLSIATLLGAVMPLAFAPYSIWPVALISPALLFLLVDREMPMRRLFLHGWLFGNGYFGFGIYWTYNSLHDFGQAPPLVAALIAALLIVYLAIFPACCLCAWQWCKRKFGQPAIWLLPIFWFAFEWLRGWLITGMPWLTIGYAYTESPLSSFGAIVGVYGVGALGILMSVSLMLIMRKSYKPVITIVLIPVVGVLLQNIQWTEEKGEPIKVAIVQGNIPQEIKWRYEQRQNIFNVYWRETIKLWDNDLIVWPETALPGRSEDIQESIIKPVSTEVINQNSQILTGVIVSDEANRRYYNSLMLLGEQQGVYHKRHLVIFGEYYPMRWLLDFLSGWINIPYSDMTHGPEDQPLLSVKELKLGLSICFENVFSRNIMRDLPDANLLVNVSNDAWFGNSLAPHQHLQMAQMRSIEAGRAMVRSTNTGISAFIDDRGRIVQVSEQFKMQTLTDFVQGRTGVTPFYYFEKIQGWLAILIVIAIITSLVSLGRKHLS